MNIGCEKESISKVRKELGELSFLFDSSGGFLVENSKII